MRLGPSEGTLASPWAELPSRPQGCHLYLPTDLKAELRADGLGIEPLPNGDIPLSMETQQVELVTNTCLQPGLPGLVTIALGFSPWRARKIALLALLRWRAA